MVNNLRINNKSLSPSTINVYTYYGSFTRTATGRVSIPIYGSKPNGYIVLWRNVHMAHKRVQWRAPGPKFLHFHAVFGNNWPNNRLAPPLGNPGSANGVRFYMATVPIFGAGPRTRIRFRPRLRVRKWAIMFIIHNPSDQLHNRYLIFLYSHIVHSRLSILRIFSWVFNLWWITHTLQHKHVNISKRCNFQQKITLYTYLVEKGILRQALDFIFLFTISIHDKKNIPIENWKQTQTMLVLLMLLFHWMDHMFIKRGLTNDTRSNQWYGDVCLLNVMLQCLSVNDVPYNDDITDFQVLKEYPTNFEILFSSLKNSLHQKYLPLIQSLEDAKKAQKPYTPTKSRAWIFTRKLLVQWCVYIKFWNLVNYLEIGDNSTDYTLSRLV